MVTRVPLGDVLRIGEQTVRVVALNEASPDTRFPVGEDGEIGEIVIRAAPSLLKKSRPRRRWSGARAA